MTLLLLFHLLGTIYIYYLGGWLPPFPPPVCHSASFGCDYDRLCPWFANLVVILGSGSIQTFDWWVISLQTRYNRDSMWLWMSATFRKFGGFSSKIPIVIKNRGNFLMDVWKVNRWHHNVFIWGLALCWWDLLRESYFWTWLRLNTLICTDWRRWNVGRDVKAASGPTQMDWNHSKMYVSISVTFHAGLIRDHSVPYHLI